MADPFAGVFDFGDDYEDMDGYYDLARMATIPPTGSYTDNDSDYSSSLTGLLGYDEESQDKQTVASAKKRSETKAKTKNSQSFNANRFGGMVAESGRTEIAAQTKPVESVNLYEFERFWLDRTDTFAKVSRDTEIK